MPRERTVRMSFFTLLIVLGLAVAVVLIVWPREAPRDPAGVARTCSQCGTVQPHHARFCRKCGQGL